MSVPAKLNTSSSAAAAVAARSGRAAYNGSKNGMANTGGGGAGGFLTGLTNITAGSLDIVIGAGGKGVRQAGGPSNGGNSHISNSVLGVILAYGGGHGGGEGAKATDGGSGGGGSHGGGLTAGKGVTGQGYDGGAGGNCDAGGGGGAGGPGQPAEKGRAGGPGRSSVLRDGATAVTYATGGSGHGRDGAEGVSKADNTGAGGDGAGVPNGGTGGNGGSGIVIVRYQSFAIGNRPVTDVTRKSATFNGWLYGTGGEATSVCVLWGDKNGGTTWSWPETDWFDGSEWSIESPLRREIRGLAADKTYYFTFGAKNATGKTIAEAPVSFITGEVTIKATQAQSWEKGPAGVPVPAAFSVSRPAACADAALAVAYRAEGTAANGTDYTSLGGTVTLPAGAVSADIVIAPWNDMLVEGDETVTLTLLPGAYIVGAAKAATVTIVDTAIRSFYVAPRATSTAPYDTWATGFSTLQAAFDHAPAKGDAVIYLAAGRPLSGPALGATHPDNTVFRWNGANNVTLRGGYRADARLAPADHPGPRTAGPTILRRSTADPVRVLTLTALTNAVIEQITIRDGLPGGRRGLGGGVFLSACSNLVFKDCHIVCNTNTHSSVGLGGGMYFVDSHVTLTDTTIATNTVVGPDSYGGGIYIHRDSRVTVTRSTIQANEAATSDGHIAKAGGQYVVPGGILELNASVVEGNRP